MKRGEPWLASDDLVWSRLRKEVTAVRRIMVYGGGDGVDKTANAAQTWNSCW